MHGGLDFHRPPQKRLNEWHSSASFLAKVEPTTEGDSPSVPHYCGKVSPTIVEQCPPTIVEKCPPHCGLPFTSFSVGFLCVLLLPRVSTDAPTLAGSLTHTCTSVGQEKVFVPTPPSTCAPGIWRTFGFFRRLKSKEVPLWAKRVRGGAS